MNEPATPGCEGRCRWIKLVASFGGAGLLPVMPGTFGSLAAAVVLLLLYLLPPSSGHPDWVYWQLLLGIGLALMCVLSVAIAKPAVRFFGARIPGPFVLDEAAGICLTLLFEPMMPGWHEAMVIGLAFAAFRLFDVTKLPPARQLERLPAGWGILCDDLAAAVYANMVCQLVLRLAF